MNKNVLIFADGIVAKHLLERIFKDDITSNHYHIVYIDEDIKPKEHKERFFFYRFDPTSFVKLSTLFKRNYAEVLIVLANRIDTQATYENVRRLDQNVSIVLFDKWDLKIEDNSLLKLDANEILSNRLFDYLPDVPVIAQNVGLGQGEIIEVLVPFGSSYVYRHIGAIEQKNWRIAAVYRNNRLLLPRPSLMIWPNDLLLLVGEPAVLKDLFRSIKQEVGQFPQPYGSNSYLFIDMEKINPSIIKHMMLETIFLHQKLNDRRLFIRVVNPNDFAALDFLKHYESPTIDVMVDYSYQEPKKVMQADLHHKDIGLFITYNRCFLDRKLRRFLFEAHIPIIALSASESFRFLQEASLILTEDKRLENISSTLFDLAIQMQLAIHLYENFDAQERAVKEIEEHFKNLAQIFSKPLHISRSKTNVIKELAKKEHLFLVFPFHQEVVQTSFYNIFCTNPHRLFFKLAKFHQIFLPVD